MTGIAATRVVREALLRLIRTGVRPEAPKSTVQSSECHPLWPSAISPVTTGEKKTGAAFGYLSYIKGLKPLVWREQVR
jgi:hypothetical protein